MKDILDMVLHIMDTQHGRSLSAYDSRFLLKAVASRQHATGLHEPEAYGRRLSQSLQEAEALEAALSITFTEFFRDPIAYALLERHILPGLAGRNAGASEIRVWSAGCASGQEAYSLAMLLADLAEARGTPLRFRIIATDISACALAVARAGVYERQSLRQVRFGHLEKYFVPAPGEPPAPGSPSRAQGTERFMIREDIRQAVNFFEYNLLDKLSAHPSESIYGDFDLVCCSNLLFYYKPSHQQAIVHKLQRAVAPGGYLMTGETEGVTVEKLSHLSPLRLSAPIFHCAQ